ncbi:hypothetical protein B6U96_15430, partial [Archaeoglobales archaeon ex4484_92]
MYKKITEILSREKSNIQNLLKTIKNIDRYQDDPISNLYKIKQEVVKIEKILKQSKLDNFVKENIEQHIGDVKSKIPKWEENIKKTFGQNLEHELRKVGFELRGHYPSLKVLFYTLKIDLENFKVSIWYGPEQEKLEVCKLVPEDVVKRLKIIHDKITQRRFNDNDFLSKVYEAYRVSLYRQNKELGAPIPISDILFEYVFLIQDKRFKANPVKNNYKEYGRVFFSYDLYRLKERR